MDLETLKQAPPWDWPTEAPQMILDALRDVQRDDRERLLAAEFAGDAVVINEQIVNALLAILQEGIESATLRGTAAIALGPVLEMADLDGFDDPDVVPITEHAFLRILTALRPSTSIPTSHPWCDARASRPRCEPCRTGIRMRFAARMPAMTRTGS